jgi:hypothetical protein
MSDQLGFFLPQFLRGQGGSVFIVSAVLGSLVGCLAGGLFSAWAAYAFGRRLFRHRVLDHARRDIRNPMNDYMQWLTAVAGEFSLWRTSLLPSYIPDSPEDEFELNRMRKLFVDQRNSRWLSKLEEYGSLLTKFKPAIKVMWIRQTELNEGFNKVFRLIESDPPEAVNMGESLGELAFEQSQLVSDFLYQLQYECLRSVAARKPRPARDLIKPRIIRTSFGRIRVVSPKAKGEATNARKIAAAEPQSL